MTTGDDDDGHLRPDGDRRLHVRVPAAHPGAEVSRSRSIAIRPWWRCHRRGDVKRSSSVAWSRAGGVQCSVRDRRLATPAARLSAWLLTTAPFIKAAGVVSVMFARVPRALMSLV